MKANGNRDFPYILSLSEPFSEQGDHCHRRPEFDYVFFGTTFVPEVSSPSLELEDAHTVLPKGKGRIFSGWVWPPSESPIDRDLAACSVER